MINLIRFEFKKCFVRRSLVIIIIVFMIVNVYKINTIFKDKGLFSKNGILQYKDVYIELFEDFGGEITEEKIEKLMRIYNNIKEKIADRTYSTGYDEKSYTYNPYNDEIFIRWLFVDELEYDYFYKKYANNISKNAYDNMQLYENLNNKYKCRENYIIANLFYNREITNFNYTEKYLYYLQYDFSTLLIFLICIYAISRVFVLEKEVEMDFLLITTKMGKKTIKAKIIASFLFIIMLTLLFGLLDYISFSVCFKSFGSNDSPLYSLANFKNTRLNMGLLEFSIISLIIKTFGILIVCTCFLLYSCLFSKVIYSYIASFITTYILFQNPISLLVNRELYKETSFVNVLNFPIYKDAFALVVGFACMILLLLLIYSIAIKNKLLKRSRRRGKYASR